MSKVLLDNKFGTINQEYELTENIYMYGKGAVFGGRDSTYNYLSGRSNGHSYGSLIENPAYIYEYLIREWVWREDVIASASGTSLVLTNPVSNRDDYYNGAYVYVVKSGTKSKITDYNGATATATIMDSWSFSSGQVIIVNITNNGTNIIKTGSGNGSVDAIGNTSSGLRKDWKFRSVLDQQVTSGDVLRSLFYESWTWHHKQYKTYNLFSFDEVATVGTISNHGFNSGTPQIGTDYTELSMVKSKFKIGYNYDYALQKYRDYIEVTPYSTTDSTYLGSSYKSLCLNAAKFHRAAGLYSYDCKWIKDYSTAVLFARKAISWYTKRKLIVKLRTQIQDGITYAIGDQFLINHKQIPLGLRNSSHFAIIGKEIKINERCIDFTLLEMI